MGILAAVKIIAPLTLYAAGILVFLMAVGGRIPWALMLVTLLLPLRNVVERMQEFPLGNQFLDILIIGMLIGWLATILMKKKALFAPTSLNIISFVLDLF